MASCGNLLLYGITIATLQFILVRVPSLIPVQNISNLMAWAAFCGPILAPQTQPGVPRIYLRKLRNRRGTDLQSSLKSNMIEFPGHKVKIVVSTVYQNKVIIIE